MTRPVLIVGVPRSGTSWILRVLGRTEGTMRVFEPDNEAKQVEALRAKRHLGRFPVLGPEDSHHALERLWSRAFAGGAEPSSPLRARASSLMKDASPESRQRAIEDGKLSARLRLAETLAAAPGPWEPTQDVPVVKSVHAALCIEWLFAMWQPRVVIVRRDPRNVIASWLEMTLPDRDRRFETDPAVRAKVIRPLGLPEAPLSPDPVHRTVWQLAVLEASLSHAAAHHPEWVVLTHEELCMNPTALFRRAVEQLGLVWAPACDRYLQGANVEGSGYTVRRVAAEQPDRWRERLSPAQLERIEEQLAAVGRRVPDDTTPGTNER